MNRLAGLLLFLPQASSEGFTRLARNRCCIRIGVIVRIGVITPILITPENMLNVSILEYCENESQTYFSIGSPSFVIYAAFKRISRWDIIRCFLIS